MSTSSGERQNDPPVRAIPDVPWSRIGLAMTALVIVALGVWEVYWSVMRQFERGYRDDVPIWAYTQRRLDRNLTGSIAILGSSRVLFDMNLEAWERETGQLPYQLALAGTNPRPFLEHLATATGFAGLLVVGVTPPLFFTPTDGGPVSVYGHALDYYLEQSPSQRIGYRISRAIEPRLAFYHFDTALFAILRRQTWWPEREGYQAPPRIVRRLDVMGSTRQVDMWHMVESDPETQALAQDIWRDYLYMPVELPPPDVAEQMLAGIMGSVGEHIRLIRERGGEVVFVRMPSTDEFREVELQGFPRQVFWDRLLRETGAVGVHFEDHPALKDVRVPEWSHIHSDDTDRFTANLIGILRQALSAAGISRPELGS